MREWSVQPFVGMSVAMLHGNERAVHGNGRQFTVMPLPFRHPSLNMVPIRLGRRRSGGAFVAPHVAQMAGGHHVASYVLATVLAGLKMFGCALIRARRAWAHAQFAWAGQPHGSVAVIATALLGVERMFTKGLEALVGHESSGIEKDSRAPSGWTSGTRSHLAMRAQRRRFSDRRGLCSVQILRLQVAKASGCRLCRDLNQKIFRRISPR